MKDYPYTLDFMRTRRKEMDADKDVFTVNGKDASQDEIQTASGPLPEPHWHQPDEIDVEGTPTGTPGFHQYTLKSGPCSRLHLKDEIYYS